MGNRVLNNLFLKNEKIMRDNEFNNTHLSISHSLDRYPSNWFLIGSLTSKKKTSPGLLLEQFSILMDTLGGVNKSHGKRLHWFARVEGDGVIKNHHLHFLLGGERVENGHTHKMNKNECCDFISRNWTYGISEVTPFDYQEDGVGYVTKIQSDRERDDRYELSEGLRKTLVREVVV